MVFQSAGRRRKTKLIQNRFRTVSEPFQNRFRTVSEPFQNRFRTVSEPFQNLSGVAWHEEFRREAKVVEDLPPHRWSRTIPISMGMNHCVILTASVVEYLPHINGDATKRAFSSNLNCFSLKWESGYRETGSRFLIWKQLMTGLSFPVITPKVTSSCRFGAAPTASAGAGRRFLLPPSLSVLI